MVYAHEAEVALLGEKQKEALLIEEGLRKKGATFITISDVLGYRHTTSEGKVIDTADYTAVQWGALFNAERDKPPPKIDDVVDVTASDFNLPKEDEAALRKIFSGFTPSMGAFSTDVEKPASTGTYNPGAVKGLLPGTSPRPR